MLNNGFLVPPTQSLPPVALHRNFGRAAEELLITPSGLMF
jgi:hypothetical protein